MKFNQTVGCDLSEFDEFGFNAVFLNIICWGDGYQQACKAPDKTFATIAKELAELFASELLITHQGPEFTGREFTTYVANHACVYHVIEFQSPW